jgi:microcystin-dependent protein
MDGYVGTIILWAGNWLPQNWLLCDGSRIPVAQYQVLYSIIGNTYGGDTTTFALPDLRGRVPVGTGQTPVVRSYALGQQAGSDNVALTLSNLPPHNHSATFSPTASGSAQVLVSTNPTASTGTPSAGAYLAAQKAVGGAQLFAPESPAPTATVALGGVSGSAGGGTVSIGNTGAGQPIGIVPPCLGINFIICWNGIYPTRT